MSEHAEFNPRNPEYEQETRRVFDEAPFIRSLGVELCEFKPGACLTRLPLKHEHRQQDGFVHAGVQATLADHTAGTAGATLTGPGERVLTAEFKINLLRAASGEALECRARVLKPGRMLIVVESDVYAVAEGKRQLVSRAMVTLAVVGTSKE
ncbi:PaaI family thioesterase [Marinobacterium sediminicola]|uniref:Medium/long-chain acyl-CoA thioesterase YigI n=1 Tax=Marinobacterium sediminicola TaxID=518898 RepID=A0ABY1RW70_9GAMM|nr:PaaI family thioesterase [Marinobacterium sediminicola]ULG70454.1 PaaI family thioesterase [Marinobacterium sediminicola]SMR69291.1 uncharacterized domain 1-containing protein [Marinobacterium sediminicola]